jgi:hypothetical protein
VIDYDVLADGNKQSGASNVVDIISPLGVAMILCVPAGVSGVDT